ncbi:hypothetical protein LQZ18_01610 [Lachnospiraceae bacterium ZAX-1]
MIEQLINEQISSDPQIRGMLTTYKGAPAFFYQKAPQDNDKGWTKPCYPRADFNIDMRYDPERKTSGTLSINVWCTTECATVGSDDPDKAVEKRLIELIGGTFYTGEESATTCAVWNRSDAFSIEGTASTGQTTAPEVFGIAILFDLTEFPDQITTAPDPIQGANSWTKLHFPQMMVIAHDEMPPIWKPNDTNPAIYWRFEGTASESRQSYAVTWYIGNFAAHVISESVTERNKWTKALIEQIQLDGEIILEDTSPMFIQQIQIRHNADPLREGQLSLTGQYGVLAQHRKEHAQEGLAPIIQEK